MTTTSCPVWGSGNHRVQRIKPSFSTPDQRTSLSKVSTVFLPDLSVMYAVNWMYVVVVSQVAVSGGRHVARSRAPGHCWIRLSGASIHVTPPAATLLCKHKHSNPHYLPEIASWAGACRGGVKWGCRCKELTLSHLLKGTEVT